MNVKSIRWFFLSWLLLTSVCGATNDWERFPIPQRTELWWVTQGSVHNGYKLFIKQFKSQLSVDEVLEYYRDAWKSDSELPGFMESDVRGWQMISRLTLRDQWVVQVKSDATGRGSEGLISQMMLQPNEQPGRIAKQNFMPMPHGGVLVSSTHSENPTSARTQTQIFSGRPKSVADQYKKYAVDQGWSLQDEYVHGSSVAQRFERSKRKLDVALVESAYGKTLVFVSEVVNEIQ